jgi:molybdopterin-biosynthesis enzyme MoeA-like protein
MAGVPKIMLAMLEAIAPTLQGGRKVKSVTIPCRVGEGTIGGPFGAIQAEFPDVKMGSYPKMGSTAVMTDLVLRSPDEARLAEAAARVREMVTEAHRAAGLPLDVEVY